MAKPYPPEVVALVCELHDSGLAQRKIAAQTGVPRSSVQGLLAAQGKTSWNEKYPPERVAEVRELYEGGLSQQQIAARLGLSRDAVRAVMAVGRVTTRPDASGTGTLNVNWKGADAGYRALHSRLERARGRARRCACCDSTEPGRLYEWANLTGSYGLLSDYVPMCRNCHRRFDNRRRAERAQWVGQRAPRLAGHVARRAPRRARAVQGDLLGLLAEGEPS